MPSLGDTFDHATDAWDRRRLYLGAAFLFVGVAVAAPGLARVTAVALAAAGVAEPTAVTVGVAVAGLAVPVVGAALFRWVPSTPRLRATGAAGVVLATFAVGGFVAIAPTAGLTGLGTVTVLLGAIYAIGVVLALWSPVVAAGRARRERDRRERTTTFVRETRQVRPRSRVPADGGEEERQLAFLLDNDK